MVSDLPRNYEFFFHFLNIQTPLVMLVECLTMVVETVLWCERASGEAIKCRSSVMFRLHRIKELLQEEGIQPGSLKLRYLGGVFRVCFRALQRRWSFHIDTIYVLEMPLEVREVDPQVAMQRITSLEPLLYFARKREAQDPQWQGRSYVNELQQRFARGDWCMVLGLDGEIASALFLSKGSCWLSPVGYTLSLPEETVGLYDVYTTPAHRRRGLYAKLFSACINACIGDGYRRAWMWIMPHNRGSLIAHNKLGMNHIIRSISLCQRWGFKWHRAKSLDIYINNLEGLDPLRAGISD